jgi:hypothetical protein
VNLATEKARVAFDPALVSMEQLRGAVEKAGYGITEPPVARPDSTTTPVATEDLHQLERQRELDDLKRKWSVSLAAGLLMMALSYLPLNVPMDVLAPGMLIIATVVQFWAGGPIYRAAWTAARHGNTSMDTLIAVGTSVAYGYSAFVTLWPRLSASWRLPQDLYYETAVIIIALILLGRWLEARAMKQTGAAIQALIGLQARTARVVRGGLEEDIPIEAVQVGDLVRVAPRRKGPGRRRDRRGQVGPRQEHAHRRKLASRERARPCRHRCDAEQSGLVYHAGHQGRQRYDSCADRAPRRAGAGVKGADAATGRPHFRGLCASHPDAVCPHVRGLACAVSRS